MDASVEPATPQKISVHAVKTLMISANNGVPNHPFLPVLIYSSCFNGSVSTDGVKALYESNGWFRVWDWSVYDYHHFHPTAHEVLTCVEGSAQLHLGGENGKKIKITAGDAVILPAGFGHKRLISSENFRVVGGYPSGQEDREIIQANPEKLEFYAKQVLDVPIHVPDPIYGAGGHLEAFWSDRQT